MATISESYATAINAKSLVVDGRTTRSASDVLGAMGLADRRLQTGFVPTGRDGEGYHIKPAPLAVALTRLFSGDSRAAPEIVAIMSQMLFEQSFKVKVKIQRTQADDMAKMVLAWHRDGVCKPCGGLGWDLVPGTGQNGARGVLSERQCVACNGAGKVSLRDEISPKGRHPERYELARWLLTEIERESGRAGPVAMAALAARMEL